MSDVSSVIRLGYLDSEVTRTPNGMQVKFIAEWLQVVHEMVVDHADIADACRSLGLLVGSGQRVNLSVRAMDRMVSQLNRARVVW